MTINHNYIKIIGVCLSTTYQKKIEEDSMLSEIKEQKIPSIVFGLQEMSLVQGQAQKLIHHLDSTNLASFQQYIDILQKAIGDAVSIKNKDIQK